MQGVGLKWPNDLLLDGRKLAGILLEMTGDPSGLCQVVVGIGLNVAMSEQNAKLIDQPAAHVAEKVPDISRNQLAIVVLNNLLPLLQNYQSQGFSAYREEWETLHVHANKLVSISTAAVGIEGMALGVSDSGALRVMVDDEVREFNGGEVSLRGV